MRHGMPQGKCRPVVPPAHRGAISIGVTIASHSVRSNAQPCHCTPDRCGMESNGFRARPMRLSKYTAVFGRAVRPPEATSRMHASNARTACHAILCPQQGWGIGETSVLELAQLMSALAVGPCRIDPQRQRPLVVAARIR